MKSKIILIFIVAIIVLAPKLVKAEEVTEQNTKVKYDITRNTINYNGVSGYPGFIVNYETNNPSKTIYRTYIEIGQLKMLISSLNYGKGYCKGNYKIDECKEEVKGDTMVFSYKLRGLNPLTGDDEFWLISTVNFSSQWEQSFVAKGYLFGENQTTTKVLGTNKASTNDSLSIFRLDGKVYIPLRAVMEVFQYDIIYNGDNNYTINTYDWYHDDIAKANVCSGAKSKIDVIGKEQIHFCQDDKGRRIFGVWGA